MEALRFGPAERLHRPLRRLRHEALARRVLRRRCLLHQPARLLAGADRRALPGSDARLHQAGDRERRTRPQRERVGASRDPVTRKGSRHPARSLAGLVTRLALLAGDDARLCLIRHRPRERRRWDSWSGARIPFPSRFLRPSTTPGVGTGFAPKWCGWAEPKSWRSLLMR